MAQIPTGHYYDHSLQVHQRKKIPIFRCNNATKYPTPNFGNKLRLVDILTVDSDKYSTNSSYVSSVLTSYSNASQQQPQIPDLDMRTKDVCSSEEELCEIEGDTTVISNPTSISFPEFDTNSAYELELGSLESRTNVTSGTGNTSETPSLPPTDQSSFYHNNNNNNSKIELERSIDRFWNVIDSANINNKSTILTIEMFTICLNLIGITLSSIERDILLKELNKYNKYRKYDKQITKKMLKQFLLYPSKTNDLKINLIKTEIIIGLNGKYNQHNKKKKIASNNNSYSISNHYKKKTCSKNNKHKTGASLALYELQLESASVSNEIKKINKTKSEKIRDFYQINLNTNMNNNHKIELAQSTTGCSLSLCSPPPPPPPLAPRSSPIFKYKLKTEQQRIRDYNEWLFSCFRDSIIDSLMELLEITNLRIQVFDDDNLVINYFVNNSKNQSSIMDVIKYLFECQFDFMSDNLPYLDYNGFIDGLDRVNIVFKNAQNSIPIIFNQLIDKNCNNNNVHISQELYGKIMIKWIKININTNRMNKLFTVVENIYYPAYIRKSDKIKHNNTTKYY